MRMKGSNGDEDKVMRMRMRISVANTDEAACRRVPGRRSRTDCAALTRQAVEIDGCITRSELRAVLYINCARPLRSTIELLGDDDLPVEPVAELVDRRQRRGRLDIAGRPRGERRAR